MIVNTSMYQGAFLGDSNLLHEAPNNESGTFQRVCVTSGQVGSCPPAHDGGWFRQDTHRNNGLDSSRLCHKRKHTHNFHLRRSDGHRKETYKQLSPDHRGKILVRADGWKGLSHVETLQVCVE